MIARIPQARATAARRRWWKGGGVGGLGLASATCCATVSGELRRPWEEARGREDRAKESRGVCDTFAVVQHLHLSLEGKKNDSSASEE